MKIRTAFLKFLFNSDLYGGLNLSGCYHEAGFDAYMTGILFLKSASKLMELKNGKIPSFPINLQTPFFDQIVNRLYMMKSFYYLNIAGPDLIIERKDTFYVFDFPETTTTQDLKVFFSSIQPVQLL